MQSEVGALLYLIGIEVGRLRSIEGDEFCEEVGEGEINFYKILALKLNKTDR